MSMTWTLAIDAAQRYQITAKTRCRRILVKENVNSVSTPTCDLLQSEPAGGTQVKIWMGTVAVYTPTTSDGFFRVGDVVGDIQTASGSCTVAVYETQQV